MSLFIRAYEKTILPDLITTKHLALAELMWNLGIINILKLALFLSLFPLLVPRKPKLKTVTHL